MKISQNLMGERTLQKNDSITSKGLFQVTEKNSENQSMMGPSHHHHIQYLNNKLDGSQHKSINGGQKSDHQHSSVLYAEFSRLEKELLQTKGSQS